MLLTSYFVDYQIPKESVFDSLLDVKFSLNSTYVTLIMSFHYLLGYGYIIKAAFSLTRTWRTKINLHCSFIGEQLKTKIWYITVDALLLQLQVFHATRVWKMIVCHISYGWWCARILIGSVSFASLLLLWFLC